MRHRRWGCTRVGWAVEIIEAAVARLRRVDIRLPAFTQEPRDDRGSLA
jgi:hypothetical protein